MWSFARVAPQKKPDTSERRHLQLQLQLRGLCITISPPVGIAGSDHTPLEGLSPRAVG